MTTTERPLKASSAEENLPQPSCPNASGFLQKRPLSLATLSKNAHAVARKLQESGLCAPVEQDAWLVHSDDSGVNHLFASALSANAKRFTDTELVCNIGLCFDMDESTAFADLCNETQRRSLKLERDFFFEAVLQNKGGIVRNLCTRKDRICPWTSPAQLGASPLAVLLILANDEKLAHLYNSLSLLAENGYIYTHDIDAVVACTTSVAQWKFVERVFGTHAHEVVRKNRKNLPPQLVDILNKTVHK